VINSALRVWCAVSVLCIASFTMVTSEFAPIGLLSQLSADLDQAPSTVGLTVTLYAWIGAASGLLSNWLNRRVPRKALLIGLMLILALSNGLAAVSPEFSSLLGARAVGALAHGVFWAIVAATAAHFGAYTFVEPFIGQVPGITSYLIAVLLFAFGAAGFLGNLLSALFIDRYLKAFILLALVAMALALVTLGSYGPLLGFAPVVTLLVIWGVAISALFTGLQTWVLRIAGDHMVPATALHTAVLNSAIGLGVIIGGSALDVAGFKGAMLSAGVVIVPAIVLMIAAGLRARAAPVLS